jgi:hypothetical protein
MIKGVKELVSNLNDFEAYVNSLCIEYGTCMDYGYGGRRKSKSNRSKTIKMKRGGYTNDIEMTDLLEKSNMIIIPNFKPLPPIDAPIDLIELTLAQLLYDISRASKQDVQNLFTIYIQLQLITQQYNMNLIIFDKATDEETKILPDISQVTQHSKGFINKIRSQLTPHQIFKTMQKPSIPITMSILSKVAQPAGGNKKTKSKAKVQPVKGGKSKKDEVKKEVKGGKAKKPTTDKKKSK